VVVLIVKRNALLDFLRVIAALGVLLAHWTWSPEWVQVNFQRSPTEVFGVLTQLARYGYLGVPIFFMISGAVVIRSAINKTPSEFLKARAMRILPLYYLAILISAGFKSIDGVEPIKSVIKDSVYSALLIIPISGANWLNPVFWTLSLEVQFYLLVMFSVLLLKFIGTKERYIPLVLSILCLILQLFSIPLFSGLELTAYLPFFLVGILASTSQSGKEKIFAILGILTFILLGTRSLIERTDMLGRTASTILLLMSCAATLLICSYWIPRMRMFQSRNLYILGLMTYPIYLFHVEPARVLLGFMLNSGLHVTASFVSVFLTLVWLSWFLTKHFEPLIVGALNRNLFPRRFKY
jgi:peptidoglycan/LPS O-acetylase OafA/YrhL